jgi:dienelactone hydrolase
MPSTKVARKASIINRTVASGGSAGGDKKAGRVNYSYWPRSPIKYMVTRTGAPGCCATPEGGSSIEFYNVGKTDNIVYNATSNVMDLYRISKPNNMNEIVLYAHGGYFLRGTEENQYALNCAEKFNNEGYNVISMAYTLQSEDSYAQAMSSGGVQATMWWLNAVISSTNNLIEAIEFIKKMGIDKINIIGYSAGATMALLSSIGESPFIQYGLKIPDLSVINSVVAIAGSLTTPTIPPTEAWPFLNATSPKMMLWIGSEDIVVDPSGDIAIKDKYNEMGRSNDCVLNIIDGADHDNIWNTNSKNLPNSDYNNLLPLGAALVFIRSM